MDNLQGENRSYWKASTHAVSYSKLAKDEVADVAVIGGGISGILTAYYLAKEGLSVVLLEAKELIGGTTGGTTAKLTSQHQTIYHDMIQRDGKDIAKQYYQANQDGRKLIESIVNTHNIRCDFRKMDAYVFSQSGSQTKNLKNEETAYKELDIDGELTDSTPLDLKVACALVMRDQAEFHPIKFLHGVLREFETMGGKVYQHTRYMDAEQNGEQLTITTDTPFTVSCQKVVLATLFPVEDPHSFYSNTLKPFTSHLTAFESEHAFDKGMYISDDDPKRTFRGAEDSEKHMLIVGGETHPTGDGSSTYEHYESIRQFAENEFGLTKMLGYWSEHDLVSPDRRPFIGRIEKDDEQMYVMTGYSKWGLAIAATGARLITDLILGKDNPYEQLLCPQRELSESEKEKAEQSASSISIQAKTLKPGQAKRFELDGNPAGMYKDRNETTHYLDLTCTHLGCEVAWNDGDETWDCPCHGSIFDAKGSVLAGPAKLPLNNVNPY
ncbi:MULTISPECIES: FAD-dependent oxidoreductase [unclassified Sporosarcina]|uniref:FAD-dependent oxidoreductase n=1 Tax=unclassified Sporosarcina TaxID=2647733 RepID=UPI00203DE161|nr:MULTISPECIES: FAD-dependent oxidoreductase [unclassified Sporosarcina]GKV64734.1 oxidoreductase [Sporosarcina sp. NCCP-2331]GLB54844.1 oxidoreductase [Sporosarcina sp. NCCP-2378]